MKVLFRFLLLALLVTFTACGGETFQDVTQQTTESELQEKEVALANIQKLEKAFKSQTPDKATAGQLLKSYIDFVNAYHNDEHSPAYTMEAAILADGLGQSAKAIELLLNYHDGYTLAPRRAEAAYLIAFIYDERLRNTPQAITYYNKVIELYPNSEWAQQATDALRIVGKSDEEVIRYFKEKNKKSS